MIDWTQRIYLASTLTEARQVIKDKLKHEGIKLNYINSLEISTAAHELLKARAEWIGMLQVCG